MGRLAFGAPTRYIQLDPSKCYLKDWDSGIEEGCNTYSNRMHNLCFDNCHSHVAQCLNNMGYGKFKMVLNLRGNSYVLVTLHFREDDEL